MEAVGQIGLGVIGQLYVGHLVRARGSLVVHDRVPARVSEAVSQGATAASSSREVAASCDVVVVALPNPDAVRDALLGPDGLLEGSREGSLVIDVSTVDPPTSRFIH